MKLSLLLLFFVFLLSCTPDQTKIQPSVEDISESVYASGVIKSKNQYQVFSTVNGIVKEILVTEGESVKKGTPLMRIFNKTSVLNTQNAQLAAEYARLSANKEKLEELKSAIDLAFTRMKTDSALWQRQETLWKQNIGTRVDLEQKELNYKNSVNNYNSAKIRYHDAERQLELAAKQSQNTLEINSTMTDEYIIKSEVDGKVYDILKSVGELITNQNPVALVGDDKEFLLELQVDEYDIVKISEGQSVFISMDSYKGQVFDARVTKINPVMNERSKSFTVDADFVSQPSVLYPFLTVEANIVIQEKKDVLTIPRSYLVDESYVLTEANEKKLVVTGLKDYQKVEIVSGLTHDDYIIQPVN
jgi:HlyD family secretion protein